MTSTLIRNGSLVTPDGLRPANLLVRDGVIAAILAPDAPAPSTDLIVDAAGALLFPGLIDCHVHFREPGLTQKATMASESRSARAGGVTTVCEMPNTVPPTVTVAALADKVRRADEINEVDLRFFFGVTEEPHLAALREVWTGDAAELKRLRKRCCGVKLYLDHSTGDQKIDATLADDAFAACAEMNIPVVAHCEDSEMNDSARAANTRSDVAAHSVMRPPESEEKSVLHAIGLARRHKAHLHVAHLSTRGGLDAVRSAKKEGLRITCEVAPHHLFLTTDDYGALGTLGKMNPPLRPVDHRDALWEGIADGTVDCVATDHAPHTLGEKQSPPPLQAPSGVPGTETMLPLLLTVADGGWPHPASPRPLAARLAPSDILRLCFTRPNEIFGLGKRGITKDAPADVVLADTHRPWKIEGTALHALCGWTPFEGWTCTGKVREI